MKGRMKAPAEAEGGSEAHNCEDHRKYDGGRKMNRDGVRIWIEMYLCGVCGKVLHIEEEILD